jgi:hypothetical protein
VLDSGASLQFDIKSHLRAYGGAGYACLLGTFAGVPAAAGVPDEDWQTMTEANPRRVLDIA